MIVMDNTLSSQIHNLISENRHLSLKGEADENTIKLLTQQYDELSAKVAGIRAEAKREIAEVLAECQTRLDEAETTRDRAVRAYDDINKLLSQVGDLVLQAARARVGDQLPVLAFNRDDPRLPVNVMPGQ